MPYIIIADYIYVGAEILHHNESKNRSHLVRIIILDVSS